jgi:uncharacterized protein involved in exopolysaccharide biosynthesis
MGMASASGMSGLAGMSGMSGMSGASSMGGSSATNLGLSGGSGAASSYMGLVATKDRLQADLDGTNAAIAKVKAQAQMALSQGSNLPDSVIAALPERIHLHDAQAALQTARKTLGPYNPQFRELNLELQTAQSQYNAAMQREQSSLKMGITPQLADLEAQRISQQAVVDNFKQQVKKANAVLVKMPSFQMRMVNVQYQVVNDFEILKLQNMNLELAKDAQDRSMPTFTVVDPPVPPVKAVFPKRAATTVFATIGGFLIGLLWQYLPMLRRQWSSTKVD